MSKKKSLGSSPIGYKSDNGSKMGFIPDLGVSKPEKEKESTVSNKRSSSQKKQSEKQSPNNSTTSDEGKKTKKKIVSYNLEVGLIAKVKARANEEGMYYSGLVSKALTSWLAEQDH